MSFTFGCALFAQSSSENPHRVVPRLWLIEGIRHDSDGLREKSKGLGQLGLRTTCRGGGMADAADLKSSIPLLT
jgi:hypothetical protein